MAVRKNTASSFVSAKEDAGKIMSASVLINDIELDKIDFATENEELFGYDEEDIKALVQSIKEIGFCSIILVTKKADGRYECLSGHSRIIAAREVGLKTIPCQIIEDGADEYRKKKILNDMNTARVPKPLKEALQINSMLQVYAHDGLSKAESMEKVCVKFKKNQSQIYRMIALLKIKKPLYELVEIPFFPYSDMGTISGKLSDNNAILFVDTIKKYIETNDGALPTNKELHYVCELAIEEDIKGLEDFANNVKNTKPVVQKKKEQNNDNQETTVKYKSAKQIVKNLMKLNFDENEKIKISPKDRAETIEVIDKYIEYLNKIKDACK